MLKFALKNMAIKKMQVILIVLSIVISAGIAVLAFNVATQVDEGITTICIDRFIQADRTLDGIKCKNNIFF